MNIRFGSKLQKRIVLIGLPFLVMGLAALSSAQVSNFNGTFRGTSQAKCSEGTQSMSLTDSLTGDLQVQNGVVQGSFNVLNADGSSAGTATLANMSSSGGPDSIKFSITRPDGTQLVFSGTVVNTKANGSFTMTKPGMGTVLKGTGSGTVTSTSISLSWSGSGGIVTSASGTIQLTQAP
jgi:hypothetical protein